MKKFSNNRNVLIAKANLHRVILP